MRRTPDHRQESIVALGQLAAVIDQRDADRRILEEALEALLRPVQRFAPVALGCQVAHHGAGSEIPAIGRHHGGLGDRGLEPASFQALHGYFAVAFIAGEGAMLQVALNRFGQHVMQRHALADQISGRAVQPRRQRGVGKQEMAVLIDRIEPHRSVLHEVGQVLLFVAKSLLDIFAVADVLKDPLG